MIANKKKGTKEKPLEKSKSKSQICPEKIPKMGKNEVGDADADAGDHTITFHHHLLLLLLLLNTPLYMELYIIT